VNIKRKKLFNLVFLFIFLIITLFINFIHSEKTLTSSDNCVACNFLNSTFMTSQINFFILPKPAALGILEALYSFNYAYIETIQYSARSPPQA